MWADTLHKPAQATSEMVSCTSMTLVVVVFGVAERVGLGAVLRSKAHRQSVAHDVSVANQITLLFQVCYFIFAYFQFPLTNTFCKEVRVCLK